MAGYEELQEGLAVLAEYLSGGLDLSRLKLLAGRVIAVHAIIGGASFIDTFRLLTTEYNFHNFTAFTITMRVYRGGGYTKDMTYLRGLCRLLEHLSKNEDLTLLYYGKIAMEHLHLIEELHWRKILKPTPLLPSIFSQNDAKQRLTELRSGTTIEDILRKL